MKILCIGSLNQDVVYRVSHIVSPGETICAKSRQTFWGGKGLNQAIATARGNKDVFIAGSVHKSETSLPAFLEENNLRGELVSYSEHPTGQAIIYVDDNGQNAITVYAGSNHTLSTAYIDNVLQNFDKGDLVLIQNEINLLDYIITKASQKKMNIVMNPSPFENSLLELPLNLIDIFIVNEVEAYQITKEKDPEKIISAFKSKFPNSKLVLTLGKKGAIYSYNDKILKHGTYQVKVVDTTAAGDTFTGFFLSSLSKNLSPETCLEYASKAASLAVTREGATVSIPSLDEVIHFEAPYIYEF